MTKETENQLRRMILGAATLGAVLIAAPIVTFWSRLPAHMVTRWDIHGDPSTAAPKWIYLVMLLGLYALCMVIMLSQRTQGSSPSGALAFITLAGGTLGLIAAYGAVSHLDRQRWQDADKLPMVVLVSILVLPSLAAGVIALAARRRWPKSDCEADEDSISSLESTTSTETRTTWSGTATNQFLLLVAVLIAVSSVYLFIIDEKWWAFAQLAAAMTAEWVSYLRVEVDNKAVKIVYGRLGLIRQTIPLERISAVSVASAKPFRHGGWGYRGSLSLFKRATVITRAGSAIRLSLTGRRELVISVDDASTGASVIRNLTSGLR